ncbi:MAG: hypothetical protein BWY08_00069 [Bacteroidetes bacterium ADurb.Bin174]|nr:MAG: hypothetical protein BWY08_00069 [Bacteroidetes bacterium ADurb.Bin174]
MICIMDNTGKKLEVTNFSEALHQAKLFETYRDKERPEPSKIQQKYWSHIRFELEKLAINNPNLK